MTHNLLIRRKASKRSGVKERFPSPSLVRSSVMSIIRTPTPAALFLIILLAMLHGLHSQEPTPAPAPALDCTDALLNLSSCLTYVEEGSNLTRPEKGCCPGLAVLLATEPICLCQLISNYGNFGTQIDTTKALMLPTVCRLAPPPATLCAVPGAPIASSSSPMSSGAGGSNPSTPAVIPRNSNSGRSNSRTAGSAWLSGLCLTAMAIATF